MNLKNIIILFITCFVFIIGNYNDLVSQKVGTELADSLLIEFNKTTIDTSKVSINNRISDVTLRINPELSRKFATDALELSRKINWKLGEANALNRIGNTYWITSNPVKAYDYYFKALIIYKEIDYKIGIATATGNIGLTYGDRRQDSLAIKYYKDALEIDKSINNLKGIVRHHLNLGVIYSEKGKYKTALDYYFESLKYTRKAKDYINEGIVHGNIGNIYNKIGNFEKAKMHYEAAIEVNSKHKFFISLSYNYFNLSLLYQNKNKFNEAIKYNQMLVALQNEIKDHSMILFAKNALLNMYYMTGKHIEAEQILVEIKNEAKKEWSVDEYLDIYASIGNYYYLKGTSDTLKFDAMKNPLLLKENYSNIEIKNLDTALINFEKCISYFDTTRIMNHFTSIYLKTANLYEFFKKYDKALIYFKKFSRVNDTLNSMENKNALFEFESKMELELKRKQLKIKELEIEKAKSDRLLFIIALGLSLTLLVTFIYLLSANLKKTKLLEEQNDRINNVNQTKDKLFAIIAHDLINPVSNFKNVTQVLHDSFEVLEKEEQLDYLSLMKQSSEGLLDMLKNLLEWSRIQRGQIDVNIEQFALINVINQNISLFKLSAMNKSINLYSDIKSDVNIHADFNLFTTVVRNIVSNAIKFTPQDGEIFISQNLIKRNNIDLVEVRIKDSGVGIAKENIDQLFNLANLKSTPGTQNEKGTGLGLLLCKDFMELQNGEIRVESEIGNGTTIILTIPV